MSFLTWSWLRRNVYSPSKVPEAWSIFVAETEVSALKPVKKQKKKSFYKVPLNVMKNDNKTGASFKKII